MWLKSGWKVENPSGQDFLFSLPYPVQQASQKGKTMLEFAPQVFIDRDYPVSNWVDHWYMGVI